MWIWQQQNWPNFTWDDAALAPLLRELSYNQGLLVGRMGVQTAHQKQQALDTLLANIIHSSAIEGEKLNAFSVRSSLAKKLNIDEQPYPTTVQSDNLAEIMLDAINNTDSALNLERVLNWHRLLFSGEQSLFTKIEGGQLRGDEPMQVVSGRLDKPILHFTAPPKERVNKELSLFFNWFNKAQNEPQIDPFIRAAIAHLWFVTIHPLEDGNGRITRLITDLALAQEHAESIRFYAMSVAILEDRKSYYEVLEATQRGELCITKWIKWFLRTLNNAIHHTLNNIEQTIFKTNYWASKDQTKLGEQQVKVLNKLLDGQFEQGISASQYQKVAKVSRATATRHLSDLQTLGFIKKTAAGGRSTRYKVVQ
ncbi:MULTISPECIES: Fic family protein [Pseudoalteromonas]|uniref:Cell division protein Fic n=1 Tax=Pseudoalteromonas fuliginea TaxID=1872678 RepID=A0ABD3Y8R5_9GAMM|nr:MULTISPECIES: Fic family protein [Pseudoalteromonas]ALQ10508.1 cell filamentation protein Fic [Pseudoalteromonas sp. Bsw20308]KDC50700.1 cell division protein Fic [Pseudoalteromonas fuliginea]KJZ28932.1 cell division protein Fic [Pseudoalteromonas fuliginea]